MGRRRSARRVGVVAGLLAALPAAGCAQDLEQAVKATYIAKFAPFVAWPVNALPTAGAPLSICVQGNDPFAALVERAAAGQQVGGHALMVRRMARVEAGAACHIAYIGGSPTQSPAEALQSVRDQPVLTVTDAAHGPVAGVVHLVTSAGRVRFSVDTLQAQGSGLVVSSKLLALALRVKRCECVPRDPWTGLCSNSPGWARWLW